MHFGDENRGKKCACNVISDFEWNMTFLFLYLNVALIYCIKVLISCVVLWALTVRSAAAESRWPRNVLVCGENSPDSPVTRRHTLIRTHTHQNTHSLLTAVPSSLTQWRCEVRCGESPLITAPDSYDGDSCKRGCYISECEHEIHTYTQ